MKINDSTRIRVDKKLSEELNLNWWDRASIRIKMYNEYGLVYTSNRNWSYYFKPTDPQRCMLFMIAYGHLLKQKHKIVKH